MVFPIDIIVRYWVWWNDLIQGPFEPDELISLHAFSENLLVCLDGREEWIPAGRVADLAPAIEQLKISRAQPLSPPPPPPKSSPAAIPLQGEFFGDSPGQQSLLESEDGPKGPYAYRPLMAEPESPVAYFAGQATMPFHFSQSPSVGLTEGGSPGRILAQGAVPQPSPLPLPRLKPKPKRIEMIAPPVSKESPVPKESLPEPFALEVLREEPSLAPTLDEPFESERKLEWLPWMMGVALAIATVGSMGYWLMDRASTHSAIAEANRLEPPAPLTLPATTPLPASNVEIRDRSIPAAVVHAAPLRTTKKSMISLILQKARAAVAVLKKPSRMYVDVTPAKAGAQSNTNVLDSGLRRDDGDRTSNQLFHKPAWLQKIMSPLSLFRSAAPVAGGAARVTAALANLPAGQAGVSAGPTGAGLAAANAAAHLAAPVPGPISGMSAPAASVRSKTSSVHSRRSEKTGIKEHAAPGRTSHPVSHGKSGRPHPSAKGLPPAAGSAAVPLPGLAVSPSIAVSPEVPAADAAVPSAPRAADPWAGHQSDAIKLVVAKSLPGGKMTVGAQAKTMLKQMHEKELMHAAETGERLYLPDKMAWAALQEDGGRYRVYLNFLAMQANGERIQTRSYQFIVDLKSKAVRADDPATEQDLLTQNAELNFKHNPMATDIDSILGGVDTYNKHQVQMIIIRKNRSNRDERTQIELALKTAKAKIQRSIIYFRRTYSEKALQNVAKAYNFLELANGK